ncbi:hypothetical protein N3K66_000463 [Trichothecium roseum]|uniref:Uncharacterized protein n=1 Tax=Trichothecium roseum TaxID=47278 RepID=A0ACC0VCA6_9HYPO|nr:hypothetical protein N3K66_000463 [Trichothecium roseum]
MELKSRPASELTMDQLAALGSLAFSNYVAGPLKFAGDTMMRYVQTNHVDLARSHIFYDASSSSGGGDGDGDGENLAFALVATREDRPRDARLAAFGVVPAAQGKGVGRRAVDMVVEAERARGTRVLELEVITANVAGVKLYERTGFGVVRELYAWERPAEDVYRAPPSPEGQKGGDGEEEETLRECSVEEVSRLVRADGDAGELTFQAYLFADNPSSQLAFRRGRAYAVISDPAAAADDDDGIISVMTLFVEPGHRGKGEAAGLIRAVLERYAGEQQQQQQQQRKKWLAKAWFDRSVGEGLARTAGFRKYHLSQYLMRRDLTL